LAVVGGGAESSSAVVMGNKNGLDLSVSIAIGSSMQIALFMAPVLVLASYFMAPHPLNLVFNRSLLGAIFLTVLIGAMVAGDGKANWFKGVQLITDYVIMAVMFYFLPRS
jgi:Ca2+:H+ antiporter